MDTNNTQYLLSLTICRQSSYTPVNLRINVNGSSSGVITTEDNVAPAWPRGDATKPL
ncbi:hypothetical protein GCM10009682_29150 [Luedemannella flava]|uniref:Uncharacterized protein n=1 Tax=Luedemannella flava TaxID=349316 RepID=A0ABP4Y6S1_9ACTN